ncbi:MAG: glycosyltransferase 87 family protein [Vulcanimicrobiaceae bacterium]
MTKASRDVRLFGSVLAGLLAIVFFGIFGPRLASRGTWTPLTNPEDLHAFLCAGRAAAVGADPYRVAPMWDCQISAAAEEGLQIEAGHVIPAPLPPYALALFALLARVPFPNAYAAWFALTAVLVAVTALVLTRLTGLSPMLVVLSLGVTGLFVPIVIGQIVPLVLCALVLAMYGLSQGRPRLAAVAAAVAMIEPNLALPACLALWVYVPATRRPLALAALAAVGLSAVLGFHVVIEYFTRVLPLQSHSQTLDDEQYGLPALLFALGAPRSVAEAAGTASLGVMLVGGVLLGGRAARALREPAFYVALPIAASVLFGPYVHPQQLAAAIPAALLVVRHAPVRSAQRTIALISVALLAIPLIPMAEFQPFASPPPRSGLHLQPPRIRRPEPQALAEIPATDFDESFSSRERLSQHRQAALVKLPTWAALIVLLVLSWRLTARAIAAPPSRDPTGPRVALVAK